MDVRRLAAAFDVLFKKSLHVWTEPETDAPGHKRHPDVLWYHQYVCRFVCEMGEYFVRFSVKECRGRGGNAVHSSTITAVSMYKAQGARATDPGKDQGEANAPFVDNKLSLFFPLSMGSGRLFGCGGISWIVCAMRFGFRACVTAAVVIVVWGMTFANTRTLLGDFSALEILVVRFTLAWAAIQASFAGIGVSWAGGRRTAHIPFWNIWLASVCGTETVV